jgi:hypothetical protein
VPFTGSHPAAVLPLLRTPLPASALVIGSMAPDTPYFVPLALPPTHRPLSVFTVDVVIGLGLWAAWHGWLSAPALATAPRALRDRLAGRVRLGFRSRLDRRFLLVPVALAVGAETHVLWDEFTHPGRFGSRHVPFLAEAWAGVPGTQWAQYVSGVFGVTALAIAGARWWTRNPPLPPASPSPSALASAAPPSQRSSQPASASPPSASPRPVPPRPVPRRSAGPTTVPPPAHVPSSPAPSSPAPSAGVVRAFPPLPPPLTRRTAWLAWSAVVLAGAVAAVPGALAGDSPRMAAFHAVTNGVGSSAATALLLAGVWRAFRGWRPG